MRYFFVLNFQRTIHLLESEIIEFSIVLYDAIECKSTEQFREFVRPTLHPKLLAFDTKVTGIQQEAVDSARPFPEIYYRVMRWIRVCKMEHDIEVDDDYVVVTEDDSCLPCQLQDELKRNKLPTYTTFSRYLSLTALFKHVTGQCLDDVEDMLKVLGHPLCEDNSDDTKYMVTVLGTLLKQMKTDNLPITKIDSVMALPEAPLSTFMSYGPYVVSQTEKLYPHVFRIAKSLASDYDSNTVTSKDQSIDADDAFFLGILLPFFIRKIDRVLFLSNEKHIQERFEESQSRHPDMVARGIIEKADCMQALAYNAFISSRGTFKGWFNPNRVIVPFSQVEVALKRFSHYDAVIMVNPPKRFRRSILDGYHQFCIQSHYCLDHHTL